MNLAKYMIQQARMRGDAPAIAFTGGVASYTMLAKAIEAASAQIAALDLPVDGVVGIDLRNPLHHTAVLMALLLQGRTSASLQSQYNVANAAMDFALVLTDDAGAAQQRGAVLVSQDWFAIDPATPPDYGALLALPGFPDPNAVARIVFSSGTTGFPKSVAFTVANIERRALRAAMIQAGPHAHNFRLLNLLGFSTIAGLMGPLLVLSHGGLVAFAPTGPDAIHLMRLFRIEVLVCAVVQLNALIGMLDGKAPLDSLETVAVAGSRFPHRLLTQARARLCNTVVFNYGSTEAGQMTYGTGASIEEFEGSAGFVLPWVTMEAVDDSGARVPEGQDGIIRVRSDELAFYLNDSPDITERFGEGWFYPGDVGRVFADGRVVITGRSNEVINRGGAIVAPELIEDVLRTIDGVADVAVFGAPGPAGIDEIWAAIISDRWVDAGAIRQTAAIRLADKVPDHIVQIDAIPRTVTGKVQREALRESLAKR